MEALLDQMRDLVEGQIDFQGQKLADYTSTIMLLFFSAVGLLLGLVQNDIHLTMWIVLAGTAVTLLVVVPPWPFFNRNPQPWIGSRARMALPHGGITVRSVKVS